VREINNNMTLSHCLGCAGALLGWIVLYSVGKRIETNFPQVNDALNNAPRSFFHDYDS